MSELLSFHFGCMFASKIGFSITSRWTGTRSEVKPAEFNIVEAQVDNS